MKNSLCDCPFIPFKQNTCPPQIKQHFPPFCPPPQSELVREFVGRRRRRGGPSFLFGRRLWTVNIAGAVNSLPDTPPLHNIDDFTDQTEKRNLYACVNYILSSMILEPPRKFGRLKNIITVTKGTCSLSYSPFRRKSNSNDNRLLLLEEETKATVARRRQVHLL